MKVGGEMCVIRKFDDVIIRHFKRGQEMFDEALFIGKVNHRPGYVGPRKAKIVIKGEHRIRIVPIDSLRAK